MTDPRTLSSAPERQQEGNTMIESSVSRRCLLMGAGAVGLAGLLPGCVGSSGGPGSTGGSGHAIVLQNSIQEAAPKAALEAVARGFDGGKVTVNSVATEQYRAQLTNYLRSNDPPEVFTWYAGSVARAYAAEDLLLDVSSLWEGDGACANFSEALRSLCSDVDGKKIFVPTTYYWWSVFYKKSAFEKWRVEPPTTWGDFHKLCENLSGQGVAPLANGIGSTPWMASGWFDYLNLRINGAKYHRSLLAGERAFTDPEVVTVMQEYKKLIPYFDPNMVSYSAQEAATPLAQNKAAMYLHGAGVRQYLPADQRDDVDFFSVPVMDASIPTAEEAPTDGCFAAANSDNTEGALAFLNYFASAKAQQAYIEQSQSTSLPTSPDVDTSNFSPFVLKGLELLNQTEEITQFFNRDSSDALQATADVALTKFLADPDSVKTILADWQKAAEGVWKS